MRQRPSTRDLQGRLNGWENSCAVHWPSSGWPRAVVLQRESGCTPLNRLDHVRGATVG